MRCWVAGCPMCALAAEHRAQAQQRPVVVVPAPEQLPMCMFCGTRGCVQARSHERMLRARGWRYAVRRWLLRLSS